MFRYAAVLTLAATPLAQAPAPEKPSPFVVHEWGTFTSMVGSDGIVLEGLQHEEEALPPFVHELANIEAQPGQPANGGPVKFPTTRVTQKMETPVIYFHTDVPREVEVHVTFPRGLLTQFYPIPMLISPTLAEQQKVPIDLTTVEGASMVWVVDLIPPGGAKPKEIPACAAEDPWSYARDVRAAYVRTRDPQGVQRAVEAEHYVFYRGLGRFDLPFGMRAERDGRGAFTNSSDGRVPFAAVLDQDENGGCFVELGAVLPGATAPFVLAGKRDSDGKRVAAALGARVFDALVREGLFEDEARAMIATWSRSWFQSRGTRAIYVLPRSQVDQVLPLTIRPEPDKLVRVLVGRLEFITPETETVVERALHDRLSPDQATRSGANAKLAALDRFLEPHVRRALAKTSAPDVQQSAREVLASLAHTAR